MTRSDPFGLGVGISSGCNFLAALEVQDELGPESKVVTVFPDDNKKYLSGALLSEQTPAAHIPSAAG